MSSYKNIIINNIKPDHREVLQNYFVSKGHRWGTGGYDRVPLFGLGSIKIDDNGVMFRTPGKVIGPIEKHKHKYRVYNSSKEFIELNIQSKLFELFYV